jgi:hypothetical protein
MRFGKGGENTKKSDRATEGQSDKRAGELEGVSEQ